MEKEKEKKKKKKKEKESEKLKHKKKKVKMHRYFGIKEANKEIILYFLGEKSKYFIKI